MQQSTVDETTKDPVQDAHLMQALAGDVFGVQMTREEALEATVRDLTAQLQIAEQRCVNLQSRNAGLADAIADARARWMKLERRVFQMAQAVAMLTEQKLALHKRNLGLARKAARLDRVREALGCGR